MQLCARPLSFPPTACGDAGAAFVGVLTSFSAGGTEVVLQDEMLSQLSATMVLAGGAMATTTGQVSSAVLAIITATVAFWGIRELKVRKLKNALNKTSRDLHAANSANDVLLSNISHDLRNPITGILGLANALEETSLTPAQHKLTESIRNCTGLLSTLIDDLLDFSKLRTGEIELFPTTFELKTCIEEIVTIAAVDDVARVALSIDLDPRLPRIVFADRARLQQIVLNYLSNAQKFGAGKPIELSVDRHSEERIRFSVRDQGYGLSRAETALLFQRFATLHSDRTLRGAGLGLATCRVLAERMDGAAGVESTVGEGSCFWLELPLRTAPAEVAIVPLSPLHNASALVVEDIDYSAAASEAILRSLGFRAESVSDGPTALKRLETSKYDLVLMDWNIPGLAGTEVAARFRAKENSDHPTIIIATTAYSAERNRDACLAAGMNAFIAKPLTPEKIAAELKRLGKLTRSGAKPHMLESNATRLTDLDFQILQFLSDGTAEGLRTQITRYQASFETDIALAHTLSAAGDAQKIASIAHRLISHAAAIKCTPIVELAGKLQRHSEALSPQERTQLLKAIDREFRLLKGKLEVTRIAARSD